MVDTTVRPDVRNINPEVAFTWLNGELQTVTIYDGSAYVRRSLTWSEGDLQSMSAWEEV